MKKINFENTPSVKTAINSINLNAIQNNAEEEINRIDAKSSENSQKIEKHTQDITNLTNRKIVVEEYTDKNLTTIMAEKWGTYKSTYTKTLFTENLSDFNKNDGFTIKKDGLYFIDFNTYYGYAKQTGIYFYVNNQIIDRTLFSGGEKEVGYCKLYNLKANDKIRLEVYTDEGSVTFTHKFSRVIFMRLCD